jgi:hypothetical protein
VHNPWMKTAYATRASRHRGARLARGHHAHGPRAGAARLWMEGGEVLGSSIDALRGTRRTRSWSRDLTMTATRRKGALAAVLDDGDDAPVYYGDRR